MNINKTNLSALIYNGKETTYFDDSLKGFGVRVGKTSSSYIVMYRNAYGKQKKLTIAKTTQITPAQAREEAKKDFGFSRSRVRSSKRKNRKEKGNNRCRSGADVSCRPQTARQTQHLSAIRAVDLLSDRSGFGQTVCQRAETIRGSAILQRND